VRVAYFGLPLGALLLHADGHEISFAVVSPVPAPGVRRLRRQLCPERLEIAADLPARVLEERIAKRLEAAPPDLVVSWYWTRRIPARWLAVAPLGGVGVHPSLLPRHRGPNPFFWAIDSGDAETGITVHCLDEGYDTGDIVAVDRLAIAGRNSWQLARALDRPGLRLLGRVMRDLANGAMPASVRQDESHATWAPEPEGDALRVNFSWPTERVLRRIRALAPVPGLALEMRGLRIFVTRAEPAMSYPEALVPGEAASWDRRVIIRTADGAIAIRAAASDLEGETHTYEPAELADAFEAADRRDDTTALT
jgi:methionyl-tRNA formyltransferase